MGRAAIDHQNDNKVVFLVSCIVALPSPMATAQLYGLDLDDCVYPALATRCNQRYQAVSVEWVGRGAGC